MATTTTAGPATYYASGSNRPADIRGFSRIGHAIGVAVPALSPAAVDELEATGGAVPVFVDSGAFSEVRFGPNGVEVVNPITDADWRRILNLYARLARALGSALSVVAPDRIGDQALTIERLARYRDELRAIASHGARVLVPVQKGEQSQADFWRTARAVLGFEATPALPCKKAATTMAELEAFATELAGEISDVHLLGLGPRNANAKRALAAFEGVEVTMDSNLITASVGRTSGPGGGPRLLTRCRDIAAEAIAAGVASGSVQELGIVLAFGRVPEGCDRIAYVSDRLTAAVAKAA